MFIGGPFDGKMRTVDVREDQWLMTSGMCSDFQVGTWVYNRQQFVWVDLDGHQKNDRTSFIYYTFGRPDKALSDSKMSKTNLYTDSVHFNTLRLNRLIRGEVV